MKLLFTKRAILTLKLCLLYITFYGQSILITPNYYRVLASQGGEDSVINTVTQESSWVTRDKKILFFDNPNIDFLKNTRPILQYKLDSLFKKDSLFFKLMPGEIAYMLINGQSRAYKRSINNPIFMPIRTIVTLDKSCDCDANLIKISGYNLHLFDIRFHPGGGSACNDPRTACEEEISSKFDFNSNVEFIAAKVDSFPQVIDINCDPFPLKIGIVDTGLILDSLLTRLNPELLRFFYNSSFDSYPIAESSIAQINIVPNNPTDTDYSRFHGTKVTNIILNMIKDSKLSIKLIPIKIANSCPGNLFDAMCGILTAKKLKVDILNTSWAYIGEEKVEFLTAKIFYLLEAENITIIASSGNNGTELSAGTVAIRNAPSSLSPIGVSILTYPSSYYPTNFSSLFSNVISVTSFRKVDDRRYGSENKSYFNPSPSPKSNYSSKFVDTGVLCQCSYLNENNLTLDGFYIPGFSQDRCYFGTSFAAANFTGYLALKYKSLMAEFPVKNSASFRFRDVYTRGEGHPTIPTSYFPMTSSFDGFILKNLNLKMSSVFNYTKSQYFLDLSDR